ncbi:MAG: glycosyltransferase family 39 protein [Azospirillaceae bacterium]
MPSAAPSADAIATARPPWWARPGWVAALVGGYLLAHFLLRLSQGAVLGIDDAEQILFAQKLQWSYRFEQPPLFTWLLTGAVELLGPGVAAAGVVRYALLALCYAAVYGVARRVIDDPRDAALALYAFATVYVFAYFAHHDLTHTTALSALIAVVWWAAARAVERPTTATYALVGAAFGLALLSKWNFALLGAGLPIAALLMPRYRSLILTPRFLVAVAVMLAVALPSAIWVLVERPEAEGVVDSVLGSGGEAGFLATLTDGSVTLAVALIAYPQPFLVLFAVAFGPALWRALRAPAGASGSSGGGPDARLRADLLWATMAVTVALHWLLVPVLGATEFEERWMQPALMVLPLALFTLAERGRPAAWSRSLFGVFVAGLVAIAFAARIVTWELGADHCGSCRTMVPFPALADQVREAGFTGGTIAVDDFHIGGNLRAEFPDSRVVEIDYPPSVFPPPRAAGGSGQCLLAWKVSDGRDGAPEATPAPMPPPDKLARAVAERFDAPGAEPAAIGIAEAPMRRSARAYRMGWALYPDGAGTCR